MYIYVVVVVTISTKVVIEQKKYEEAEKKVFFRAGIETVAPFVIGLDPRRALEVERAMDHALPGHLYAKSPIDMACWDISGQAAGLPIADLMGGGSRSPAPIASSVGAKTIEETRAVMDRYRDRGYWVHSVKVGGDVDRDIERIRDVEAHRPAGERILYDVNRAWTRQQALRVMKAWRRGSDPNSARGRLRPRLTFCPGSVGQVGQNPQASAQHRKIGLGETRGDGLVKPERRLVEVREHPLAKRRQRQHLLTPVAFDVFPAQIPLCL